MLKSLLLFFAMDDSLQGARWILESIVQPVVGFFAAPDSSTSSLAALADREREQQREDAEVEDHNDESKQVCMSQTTYLPLSLSRWAHAPALNDALLHFSCRRPI